MNDKVLFELECVIADRRNNPQEGSYTCYLFDKGLDKILKKVGEECAETIIAAKNADNNALTGECADLIYHMLVMMNEKGLPLSDVLAELEKRSAKIGNLKTFHTSDHNS